MEHGKSDFGIRFGFHSSLVTWGNLMRLNLSFYIGKIGLHSSNIFIGLLC